MAESEDYLENAMDHFRAFEVGGEESDELEVNNALCRACLAYLPLQKQLEELKSNFSGTLLWDYVYAHIYTVYQMKKQAVIDDAASESTRPLPNLVQFPQSITEYQSASYETRQIVAERGLSLSGVGERESQRLAESTEREKTKRGRGETGA